MRTSRGVAAIAFLAATVVTSPAGAATVCLENLQFTFDQPLQVLPAIGRVTVAHQATCADLGGPSHYSGSYSGQYFGSCALVVIDDFNDVAFIVGGTSYTWVRGSLGGTYALQPDAPCPISSAHGTGTIVAVP